MCQAYVVYEDIFDAKNACEHLSGFNVMGRYLTVVYHQAHKVRPQVDRVGGGGGGTGGPAGLWQVSLMCVLCPGTAPALPKAGPAEGAGRAGEAAGEVGHRQDVSAAGRCPLASRSAHLVSSPPRDTFFALANGLHLLEQKGKKASRRRGGGTEEWRGRERLKRKGRRG